MNLIDQTQAIKIILKGEIVALPTETVYGLFGLGNSQDAVNKVYKIKNRPADNPLICHFYSYEQILKHTTNQPKYLELLIKSFCPGPITFLLELNPNSDLKPATAGQTKICCRIPDNQITLEILKKIGVPLFGPSANSSTRVSGTSPEIIFADLGNRIAGIVDGGVCEVGLESTIIDCTDSNEIKILRPGAIGKKEIEEVLSNRHSELVSESPTIEKISQNIKVTENQKTELTTPGAKYRHYSPKTKIIKIETNTVTLNSFQNPQQPKTEAEPKLQDRCHSELVSESPTIENKDKPKHYILGFEEDLSEISENYSKINLGSIKYPNQIAHNLFQNLFNIDKLNQEQIYFYNGDFAKELFSSNGTIEQAVCNRLNKILG
jgi:tRNA threonylcarbamoyl adenosine modification protein (Sua5/YciO/YrdC/YwlC family)